jgi:hypothetical protein
MLHLNIVYLFYIQYELYFYPVFLLSAGHVHQYNIFLEPNILNCRMSIVGVTNVGCRCLMRQPRNYLCTDIYCLRTDGSVF